METAEEFLEKQELKISHNLDRDGIAYPSIYCEQRMIEFAKMHVQAALKTASEKASVYANEGGYSEFVDEHSILNSYPESNIK